MGRWTGAAREIAGLASAALFVALALGIPWVLGWIALALS